MTADPFPEWLRPEQGFMAADLDRLPDLPDHTELIDGGLVFMSPQRLFHLLVIKLLESGLDTARPAELRIRSAMTVTLGPRTRVEPDVVVVKADAEVSNSLTGYQADDVLLVVEVVSPESEIRDRDRKPQLYARAGVRHFWRVEEVDGEPVVYAFELDPATGAYMPAGVHHKKLSVTQPFPVDVELDLAGH